MEVEFKNTINKEEIDSLPGFVYNGEVTVIEREEDVDEAVGFLSGYKFIGFDTETKPSFKKGESHKVCLLQLSVDEKVFLFRLNKCGLTSSLCELLADPKIVKIGVGIRDDVRVLRKLSEFKPASFLELQSYAVNFGIEEKSFSKLMAIIFGVKISKRQRVSNWEAPRLTESQVRYAATDAWGALTMYKRLASLN